MKIIESFICGKKNIPELCEDGLFLSDGLIAVIDGVTAKGRRKWNGKSSGCYAKDKIMECLSEADITWPAMELLSRLNKAICPEEKMLSEEEYPRAAIILYNDYYKEVWCYGDCQCMVDGVVYHHDKEIDKMNAELRAFALEHALLKGSDIESLIEQDIGRQMIKQTLLMQFDFENRQGSFGYPILNGDCLEPVLLKKYPVKQGTEIVLASDGYPVLCNTLEESERIRKDLQRKDPLCFRENRETKGVQQGNVSFDDRTYCRFVV